MTDDEDSSVSVYASESRCFSLDSLFGHSTISKSEEEEVDYQRIETAVTFRIGNSLVAAERGDILVTKGSGRQSLYKADGKVTFILKLSDLQRLF